MDIRRYKIYFKGRVQNVGFRYKSKILATNLNLSGYVRNLTNGDVEMEIQGEMIYIQNLLDKLNHDWVIDIREINKEEIEIIDDEREFKII
ncbi:MAG: acylphosphatase [Tissierellia bacterium]|nr:acylphosphatase [Tissierellia bacterium]